MTDATRLDSAAPAPAPAADGGVQPGGVLGWIDERFGVGGLRYPVPRHANSLAFTLGGISLASFVGLVVTGIYLAQFYDPTPSLAHTSVVYITDTAFAGTLIRSLHYWLATAFVVAMILHMLRTFATASFKAPREGIWITGVVLFLLTAGLLFSGTVLKQDQESFEALAHNTEIASLFGAAGFWFSADFTENISIVTRLYIAHVSILPLLVVAVLAVHMLLISVTAWRRCRGVRRPRSLSARARRRVARSRVICVTSGSGAWCCSGSSCSRPACCRPVWDRPAWKASRSPSRRGTSSGCTRSRTGSA